MAKSSILPALLDLIEHRSKSSDPSIRADALHYRNILNPALEGKRKRTSKTITVAASVDIPASKTSYEELADWPASGHAFQTPSGLEIVVRIP